MLCRRHTARWRNKKTTATHLQENYGTFRAFVKDLEIGSYRKVMYLIAMVNDMKKHGYSRREMRTLLKTFGTTKVVDILSRLPGYSARDSLSVMCRSASDGSAIPLGWLCPRTTAEAL